MNKTVITATLVTALLSIALLAVTHGLEQERHARRQRMAVYHTLSNVQTQLRCAASERAMHLRFFRDRAAELPALDRTSLSRLTKALVRETPGISSLEVFHENRLLWIYPERLTSLVGTAETALIPRRLLARLDTMDTPSQVLLTPPMPDDHKGTDVALMTTIRRQEQPGTVPQPWGYVVLFIDNQTFLRQAGVVEAFPNLRVAVREAGQDSQFIYGGPAVFEAAPVRLDVRVPGADWELAGIPAEGWSDSPYLFQIWAFGLPLALIGTLGAWLLTRQLQLRAREREEYRHLVQNARTIILRFDIAGRITFMNEYGLQFFGYEEKELLGQPIIGTIVPPGALSASDMRRMLIRLIDSPGKHSFHENENVLASGERVWVAWSNKAVLDGRKRVKEILSVGTDITERRRFEEALRESEKKHRMLAENITDVIWGLDANLNFTYITPSDRQLRGYPAEEVLNRPLWDFVAPGSRATLLDGVAEIEAAEGTEEPLKSLRMTLELTRKDGGTVWVETLCTILYSEDAKFVGLQGVCRDITDRIRIQALREDVERMARHDLKTPLSAVIGLPAEVAKEGVNDRQRELLDVISRAGKSMLDLVNRSLDLHKMETGTYELQAEPVDLGRLLNQIRAELRSLASDKSLSIAQENGEESVIVMGEEVLLHSMISNLLKNAMEASPEGAAVSIRLRTAGRQAMLTIRNKGEVPKELRETFFNKYSRSKKSRGSGLGTYSARLVARTHGGDIILNTSLYGETEVSVSIPLMRG